MSDPSRLVALVLVSHSGDVAGGVAELVGQVAGPHVPIVAVGGGPNGSLGTDGGRVFEAISAAAEEPGVVVLMDVGSSVLSVRAALEELDPSRREHVVAADAPLVEGAIAAAVTASTGAPLAEVAAAAQEARHVAKL